MGTLLRRTVFAAVSALSAAALATSAVGAQAAPDPTPTPPPTAEPSFTISWHEHAIHESGSIMFWELATIHNDGGTDLDLVSTGFDGIPYTAVPTTCTVKPGESCEVPVGDAIIGGDYPSTRTRELSATMRTPDGATLTRGQAVTLTMVDDPPLPPYTVETPPEGSFGKPTFCLSWYSERFQVVEPRTLVTLTSDTYGDVLDPANSTLKHVAPWPYCQLDYAWQAVEAPAPAETWRDVVHMTFEDDDGNRVTESYDLAWPGQTDPEPQPPITTSLVADRNLLDETGEVATFTLTVTNPRAVPETLSWLRTSDGRDLLAESEDPNSGTACDSSHTVPPSGTLTCRFASRGPLSGQAGTTYREEVDVFGPDVTDAPYVDLTFRDVPPDAQVTAATQRPSSLGATLDVLVVVTGTSGEPGVIEAIDVLGLAPVTENSCAPGTAIEQGATYRCRLTLAPVAWRLWFPLVVAVRVRDDEGTAVTRTAWVVPARS